MPVNKKNDNSLIRPTPGSLAGAEGFLRILGNADDPLALVAPLAAQDLLVTLRAADDEQKAELMLLMDREQIKGVVDLCCWSDNMPALGALLDLLEPLVTAGLDGSVKAYYDMEEELRTLLLKKYIVVHLHEDKNDEVEALEGSELIRCPDGHYYIEILDPDDVPQVFRQLLEGLLSGPFEEYQRELETVRHDFPTDLEESALRWRSGRMGDLGFGTLEDGLAMLSPRDPASVRAMLGAASGFPHPMPWIPVPALYSENLAGATLLDRALELLGSSEDPAMEGRAGIIMAEMAVVASLYLTATRCDLGNVEEMASATEWARDILALGLDSISDGDPLRAADALAKLVPAIVFQAGMGLLVPLRGRSRRLLADGRLQINGIPGLLLDPPHFVTVSSLARQIPGRWPPLDAGRDLMADAVDPLPGELVAFSNVEEVERARRILAEAEQVPRLLFDILQWDPSSRQGPAGKVASVVVLTALANAASGGDPLATPVAARDAETFAELALSQDAESFCADGMAVLASVAGCAVSGPMDPGVEEDPLRRALLRLVRIGRSRLEDDAPVLAVITG